LAVEDGLEAGFLERRDGWATALGIKGDWEEKGDDL
jgi:hypothetical protein